MAAIEPANKGHPLKVSGRVVLGYQGFEVAHPVPAQEAAGPSGRLVSMNSRVMTRRSSKGNGRQQCSSTTIDLPQAGVSVVRRLCGRWDRSQTSSRFFHFRTVLREVPDRVAGLRSESVLLKQLKRGWQVWCVPFCADVRA